MDFERILLSQITLTFFVHKFHRVSYLKDRRKSFTVDLRKEILRMTVTTHSFFCRLRKVIESPYPLKASSAITEMLLARKSRWRRRCRRRSASLGIECRLLSPNLRYCRFSANSIVRLLLMINWSYVQARALVRVTMSHYNDK